MTFIFKVKKLKKKKKKIIFQTSLSSLSLVLIDTVLYTTPAWLLIETTSLNGILYYKILSI